MAATPLFFTASFFFIYLSRGLEYGAPIGGARGNQPGCHRPGLERSEAELACAVNMGAMNSARLPPGNK